MDLVEEIESFKACLKNTVLKSCNLDLQGYVKSLKDLGFVIDNILSIQHTPLREKKVEGKRIAY